MQIIHQTWKTSVVPDKWLASVAACKELHPDWEFRLWTDETAREVIAADYPESIKMYDNYRCEWAVGREGSPPPWPPT
jgi:inositol phosphorylceramide mannosyltransferase catalytic subunit